MLQRVVCTAFLLHYVNAFSLSNPLSKLSDLVSDITALSVNADNTAQDFDGWGTSLAWFAEYVGGLESAYKYFYHAPLKEPAHVAHLLRIQPGTSRTKTLKECLERDAASV